MTVDELLPRVALAFGIGLLIGLERGWHRRAAPSGGRTAGVRTLTISGLLGGIVAAIAQQGAGGALSTAGSILLGAAFLAYAGVITIFSRDENKSAKSFSATTTIAALLTFMLGAYALIGDVRVAAASAVAAAGILMAREALHAWVEKITPAEFQSGLVLLAMTFIALPVVPNHPIGVLGGVNLREVWLIAIVLASLSFAGYVAVKLLGVRRGILIAAAAGGLVSSTAVTLANARRAAAGEGLPHLLAAGTALAMAVSFMRVTAIVTVLKPTLVPLIAPALVAASVVAVGFAIAAVFWRRAKDIVQTPVQYRNPFGFWSVVGMALSMGVLIVVGRLIFERFGSLGAIAAAATMGLFDVDAMTVSMTRLVPAPLDLHSATYAILAGVASNTFTKMVIGALIGRGRFAVQTAIICIGCVAAGWLALMLTLSLVDW